MASTKNTFRALSTANATMPMQCVLYPVVVVVNHGGLLKPREHLFYCIMVASALESWTGLGHQSCYGFKATKMIAVIYFIAYPYARQSLGTLAEINRLKSVPNFVWNWTTNMYFITIISPLWNSNVVFMSFPGGLLFRPRSA